MSAKQILVVEDERPIREMIAFGLRRAGFEVREAADARSGRAEVANKLPDLLLVDWMLPDTSGLEFTRALKRDRETREVPIIMLTARAEEGDKVAGLEGGADDYITKPFSIREFRSRIRALLRRAASPHLAGEREELIERGELRIDVPRRTVEVRGEAVQLTFIEFEMLVVLAQTPGVVYSRRELLERLRGGADYREPRTIDVHVRHLREKIERDPSDPELILTMRGAGYRFRSE